MASLTLTSLDNVPMIRPGNDLASIIAACIEAEKIAPQDGDVIVLAQKIVSKAEGCFRRLSEIAPTEAAELLAAETGKDARLVQAVLDESSEVVRKKMGVLVVRHKRGWVVAQAGIDQSNFEGDGDDEILLLPQDPDASASAIRSVLEERFKVSLGIVIADSFGRPFRNGTSGTAIGASGLASFIDMRGEKDLYGRELMVSTVGHADELAAAASLLMGQAAEGRPVVLISGLPPSDHVPASVLIRPLEEDLFR